MNTPADTRSGPTGRALAGFLAVQLLLALYKVGPAKCKPTRRHPNAKAQNAVVSWAFIGSSRWNTRPMGAL